MRCITFVYILLVFVHSAPTVADDLHNPVFPPSWKWTSATENSVITQGNWTVDRFRFADASHRYTTEDQSSLKWTFDGSSIAIRLAGQNTSSYPGTGLPSHGKLSVYIDGVLTKVVYPAQEGREFTAATNLSSGLHELLLVHTSTPSAKGVRVERFLTSSQPVGVFNFNVTGELQEYLNDVRCIISKNGQVVRSTVSRNWMTGKCSFCLPAGQEFEIRIEAIGWDPQTIKTPIIKTNQANTSAPVYLRRNLRTQQYRFRSPRLNNQAIRRPGEQFTARFLGFDAKINEVRIRRQNGDAIFSRVLAYTEDAEKAFYYDRQVDITLPEDTPPGIYDLEIDIVGGRRTSTCRSPSSVAIVKDYPKSPRFITFGHLDTSGQFQAEYVQRMATMANIIGADMVLASNSVNAAYLSGALSTLQIPYLINFGNHQVFGHHRWYGPDLGGVSYGPHLFVLNYGLPWHEPIAPVIALLKKHREASIKVINAFEHNAPDEVLDEFRIALIHDAHGPGDKLMEMGSTPTQRVGKSNSESFRLVEFHDGKVINATYNKHPTAPIPFTRDEQPPLRVQMMSPTKAIIINEYKQAFTKAKLTFLVPRGNYVPTQGIIKSSSLSDDGQFTEVIVEIDVEAAATSSVTLTPQ